MGSDESEFVSYVGVIRDCLVDDYALSWKWERYVYYNVIANCMPPYRIFTLCLDRAIYPIDNIPVHNI